MPGRMHVTRSNPWQLTAAECRVMRALVRFGDYPGVARSLQLAIPTVKEHVYSALKKMNAQNKVVAAVMWDRFVLPERGNIVKPVASVFELAEALQ